MSVGSLQERQHSLLRPCYYPVLANGRMLCVVLNFAKSCAFFIESPANRVCHMAIPPCISPCYQGSRPTETGSPMTASTASPVFLH